MRIIHGTFSFQWPVPFNKSSRLTSNELAGGGILDVGCYPASMSRLIAGAALIVVAVLMLHSAKIAIPAGYQAGSGAMAGFLGGLLGGTSALPGPIVFTYLIGKGLRGKAFTKEASLFLVISSGFLALVLTTSRQVSWAQWALSLAALLPVGVGMFFGRQMRDWMSAESFKRLVLVVVIFSGMGLVRKGYVEYQSGPYAGPAIHASRI